MKAVHGRVARTGVRGRLLCFSGSLPDRARPRPGTGGGTLRTDGSRTASTLTRYSMSRPTSGCSSRTLAMSPDNGQDLEPHLRCRGRGSLPSKTEPGAKRRARTGIRSTGISLIGSISSVPKASRAGISPLRSSPGRESLEALLEAGKHLSVAVNVAKGSGACRRFEHAAAFDFQLVFELGDHAARDLHFAQG